MQTVIVSGAAGAALREATTLVEIRDDDDALLGFFAPNNLDQAESYARAAASFQRKAGREGPAMTTEDVLQKLQALEPQ